MLVAMEIPATINTLQRFGHFSRIVHVTLFEGVRQSKEGEHQRVTIKISDNGELGSPIRFSCSATTSEGKSAAASSAPSLDQAIALTHWDDLDR